MCKVIVITSGKGGVGKTTAVANIGSALACYKNKVVLIDTDIGLRNLDVILGLEEKITFDIVDVAEGICDVRQALVNHPAMPTLFMLPAAQTRDKESVSPDKMREIINQLKDDFDYILIDCPAGIEQGFKNAVAGADSAIVVTNPEVSAVRDADRVIGLLAQYDIPAPKLLINKIRPRMVKRGDMMSVDDIVEVLGIDLLGLLPDDESIIKAGNIGSPVIDMPSVSAAAYKNAAKRIMGADVEFLPIERSRRRLFFNLFLKKGGLYI
ncbi:MAG: septum site-determining protein MinD [Clostridia bacterium]|nr:septum site-determining protein MinD [Clostridia bacterium]